MRRTEVAVFSREEALLDLLREQCSEYQFLPADIGSRAHVAVVDSGVAAQADVLARIILLAEGEEPPPRLRGDLALPRAVFLASPRRYLELSMEFCDADAIADQLREELDFLQHVQELTTIGDSGVVSTKITATVLAMLGLPHGTLLLHDPDLERYVASFTTDPAHRDTGDFLPGIRPDLLHRAINSAHRFAYDAPAGGKPGLLVIPMQVEDDMIGVLKVPFASLDQLDEEAAIRATHYIGMVTSVLGNVYQLTRTQDLAMRDDLTKAFNRRYFESHLDEEIERARRYNAVLSVIFLDLDDLKLVNNMYGHLFGSRTLQEVAKRILGAVRAIDKVVRFGGDEFCIILPQTDHEQAHLVATRVRDAIASKPLRLDNSVDVVITASFGIASYPLHATTKEELIRCADAAMYRVKSTTKNSIGIAEVDLARKGAAAPKRR